MLTPTLPISLIWIKSFFLCPIEAPVQVTINSLPTLRQLDSVTISRIQGGHNSDESKKENGKYSVNNVKKIV